MYGIWIDIDPQTGRYAPDGNPVTMTDADYAADPRSGTTAMFVDLAADHTWAQGEYYGQTVRVTAAGGGTACNLNWRPILAAFLAYCDALDDEA